VWGIIQLFQLLFTFLPTNSREEPKIRSFEKEHLGYFGKDVNDVSKDIKDKGLYTILSAGLLALPFVACGTDNPVTPPVDEDIF